MASRTGQRWPVLGQRLHPEFPYIEAEVRYAIKEYAATAVDVIARRLRLSFLNVQAAEEALPRIIEIMGEELKWSSKEKAKQMADAMTFLNTQMGKDANRAAKDNIPITLTKTEVSDYVKRFNLIDADKKGYVSLTDIRRLLRVIKKTFLIVFKLFLKHTFLFFRNTMKMSMVMNCIKSFQKLTQIKMDK
jgi:glycerol-3-phosphate dehydrogenase